MLGQLGQKADEHTAPVKTIMDEITCFGGLDAGTTLAEKSNIFPRIQR